MSLTGSAGEAGISSARPSLLSGKCSPKKTTPCSRRWRRLEEGAVSLRAAGRGPRVAPYSTPRWSFVRIPDALGLWYGRVALVQVSSASSFMQPTRATFPCATSQDTHLQTPLGSDRQVRGGCGPISSTSPKTSHAKRAAHSLGEARKLATFTVQSACASPRCVLHLPTPPSADCN